MTVRNDATRRKLRPHDARQPRSVVARQGQVLLDADLDEQSRYVIDRIETGTADSFGSPQQLVVPAGSTAFAFAPADGGIGAGHGYLGGWLLDNPARTTLRTQPHPRDDSLAAPAAVVVKSLVRHVDPVEEPAWADPALGDAQAPGRALLDWQVFPFPLTPAGERRLGCADVPAEDAWQQLIAPSTGTLTVVPDTAPPASDPCSLAPAGGYSRAENLLYRIEVDGGVPRDDLPDVDGPRFGLDGLRVKLSRRNASVMATVTKVEGATVTVSPPALDPLNWFAPGSYAEVVSAHDDLDPRAAVGQRRLFRVLSVSDTEVVLPPDATTLLGTLTLPGWYLRLWDAFPDASGLATVSLGADPSLSPPIDLGDGLAVRLGAGAGPRGTILRRGDYWTFAARADGSIDWPDGAVETPHGPEVRYASLAVVTDLDGGPDVQDCRVPLATLTDRVLLYRGGDGQEVMAPSPTDLVGLPTAPTVAVVRGRTPVAGATVQWTVPAGDPAGRLDGQPLDSAATVNTTTTADGLCGPAWEIDADRADVVHRVRAQLLDDDGVEDGPAILFTASFRTAAATSYQPGACDVLADATTVQEALDELCRNLEPEPSTLAVTAIRLFGGRGITDLLEEEIIRTGREVREDAFLEGINIGISGPLLEPPYSEFDQVVDVELDLPYPTTDPERRYWAEVSRKDGPGITATFGFSRVRLDGFVEVVEEDRDAGIERGLRWTPSPQAQQFLASMRFHLGGYRVLDQVLPEKLGWKIEGPSRLLCRLRVRAVQVWSLGRDEKPIYLNAEHLGIAIDGLPRPLSAKDRDPQRAGDLDIYFYLAIG